MDVDIFIEVINKYYRATNQNMIHYWRKEQRPHLTHMLQTLCKDPSIASWSKRNGLAKAIMNRENQAWLN